MIATVTPNPCIDYAVQVDELLRNETVRAKGTLQTPGGGGVNVSRVIQRLGDVPTTCYGFAGGHGGAHLRALLDAEGVAHDFLDTGLETRTNVLVSLMDRSSVRIHAAGPECDEKMGAELIKKLGGLDPTPAYVVLSGSLPGRRLPPGLSRDFYGRLIDELKKKPDIKIVLDARELALGHGVDRGPWLVKPNEKEMARLAGRKELVTEKDFATAVESFLAKYPIQYFVVSRGARGALVLGKDDRYKVGSPEQLSHRRVGAGDAFVGGLVWSLAKGDPIDVAARHAVAVGSAFVNSPAEPLFRREEVEKYLAKTQVEPF